MAEKVGAKISELLGRYGFSVLTRAGNSMLVWLGFLSGFKDIP